MGGPEDPAAEPRHRRGRWRIGTPVVVLLSGALFAVSYDNSEGTDLRPGRYTDLASLAQTESDEYEDLQAEIAALRADREELTASVDDQALTRLERKIDEFARPGGPRGRERSGRDGHPVRRLRRDRRPGDRGRRDQPQPPRGAPAGHPGRGQRDVAGRRGGDHAPGPADRVDDRHQVRGQRRADPGRALPPALRHLGDRQPVPRSRRRSTATATSATTAATRTTPTSAWAGAWSPTTGSGRRRTTACSTSATPSRSAEPAGYPARPLARAAGTVVSDRSAGSVGSVGRSVGST